MLALQVEDRTGSSAVFIRFMVLRRRYALVFIVFESNPPSSGLAFAYQAVNKPFLSEAASLRRWDRFFSDQRCVRPLTFVTIMAGRGDKGWSLHMLNHVGSGLSAPDTARYNQSSVAAQAILHSAKQARFRGSLEGWRT